MTKFKSNMIIAVVISFTVIGSVYAYYQQKQRDSEIAPQIINQLIVPYQNALKSQNFKEAYDNLTSEEYKSYFSFEVFKNTQDSNVIKYGKLIALKPLTGLFLMEKGEKKPWIFKGTIAYIGEKGKEKVQFDVIKENGRFKLYKTYFSQLAYSYQRPTIF